MKLTHCGLLLDILLEINLPDIVAKDPVLAKNANQVHEIFGYMLVVAIALHALGAFKHHIIDKDSTLRRMAGKMNAGIVVALFTVFLGGFAFIQVTTSDFKTIEYTLHIENSVGIQAQKVLVSRSGTTPYSQEYAIMYSSDLLVSIGSSYTGGNYYLNATPETGISGVTTYNFIREIMS